MVKGRRGNNAILLGTPIYYGGILVRYQSRFLVTCVALLLVSVGRTEARDHDSKLTVHRLWGPEANDGRIHAIEAIALSDSGETLYVVEGVFDVRQRHAKSPTDGEYLLWTLDTGGRVLNREFIAKSPTPRPPSRAMIVPLPEGAIVIGVFDDEQLPENRSHAYSFLRVDREGKIAKPNRLPGPLGVYYGATLSDDAKSILLAGQYAFGGGVTAVDLDGNLLWKESYLSKTDRSPEVRTERVTAHFRTIVPSDEQGGFLVAGDFGKLNKFGVGERTIWILRCDAEGKILSETTMSGRMPSICALGDERFAMEYDRGSAFEFDGRVSKIDLELQQEWEEVTEFTSLFIDEPHISAIPSTGGFVLAGQDMDRGGDKKTIDWKCSVYQYNGEGQIVASAAIPIAEGTHARARVACAIDHAYVGIQTKGRGSKTPAEAAIFEIPLQALE
jgi:hypothetical protein